MSAYKCVVADIELEKRQPLSAEESVHQNKATALPTTQALTEGSMLTPVHVQAPPPACASRLSSLCDTLCDWIEAAASDSSHVTLVYETALCVTIRLVFIAQVAFAMYYLHSLTHHHAYLLMTIGIVLIAADGLFVAVRCRGKEFTWFSLSTFVYTLHMLVFIWTLTIWKYKTNAFTCAELQDHILESKHWWLSKLNDICAALELFVAMFIITVVLARWLYPIKKKFERHLLSGLLVTYITRGADIVEFFSFVEESVHKLSVHMALVFLVFFSLSVVQFSVTLVMTRPEDKKAHPVVNVLFGTAIWSILFTLICHEIPFCCIRAYILAQYDGTARNYSFYFFVAKNVILCLFEMHHIMYILLFERRRRRQCTIKQ